MQRFEAFGDGLAFVCETAGRKLVKTKGTVHFGVRTVGIKRYFEAKVISARVDRLVSVPYTDRIEQSDILVIGMEQYKIIQIQEKMDTLPKSLYLSLEKNVPRYQDARENNAEGS